MIVYLIGFMGSGKSSVGKKLAKKIGFQFIDMDKLIEAEQNQSVSEIFSKHGEQHFRKIEYETLRKISCKKNAVVACGGGSPCFFDSIQIMNTTGISFYLKGSVEFLCERLHNAQSSRPLIDGLNPKELKDYIEKKMLEREAFYTLANYTVSAISCNADEIAAVVKTEQIK